MQKSKLLKTPEKFSSDNLYIKNIEAIEINLNREKHKALKFTVRKGQSKKLSYYYYYIPGDITQKQADNLIQNRDDIITKKMCLKPVDRLKKLRGELRLSGIGVINENTPPEKKEAYEQMLKKSLIIYERP